MLRERSGLVIFLVMKEIWEVGVRDKEDGQGVCKERKVCRVCLKKVMEGERSQKIRKNSSKWRYGTTTWHLLGDSTDL